jgi:hypothetical protein
VPCSSTAIAAQASIPTADGSPNAQTFLRDVLRCGQRKLRRSRRLKETAMLKWFWHMFFDEGPGMCPVGGKHGQGG